MSFEGELDFQLEQEQLCYKILSTFSLSKRYGYSHRILLIIHSHSIPKRTRTLPSASLNAEQISYL